MDNQMSRQDGVADNPYELDDGELAPDAHQSNIGLAFRLRGDAPRSYHPGRAAPRVLFDFNNIDQPLPWNERPMEPAANERIQILSFADSADDQLLTYLKHRLISADFLREIDLFFEGHPEIASCAEGRNFILQLNMRTPLQAYKYFLRGYTRPARYIDGIIKTDYFQLESDFNYCPIRKKYDAELDEFFEGLEHRHDVIDCIDREVSAGIEELRYGYNVSTSLTKLICYAVRGNPIDAYKWFEYSHQKEYMSHRYVPEHVVLEQIPKANTVAAPRPCDIGGFKKHAVVRYRMARANDQGIDVLDVLLMEFKLALMRKGHRRRAIHKKCAEAKQRLQKEQCNPTGIDIVDMIMDEVFKHHALHRRAPISNQYET